MTPELTTVLKSLYRASVHTTAGALILLEIVKAEREGTPHSLRKLSAVTGIPYTSVSRIAFALSEQGFLRIERDTKDRRAVHIRAQFKKVDKALAA